MKRFFRRILKFLAYLGAGLVVSLAIAVGLFRLFLPRLPEYQEDIKRWAEAAIGMQVEFSAMNARWRLSGPELNFYDAALTAPGSGKNLFQASEISVSVGVLRLLKDRKFVVDRILVRDTALDIQHGPDSELLVQGISFDDIVRLIPAPADDVSDMEFIGQDITVRYQPESGEAISFVIDLIEFSRDDDELDVEASVELPDGFGSRLNISANHRINAGQSASAWQLYVDGRSLDLPNWSRLAELSGLNPAQMTTISSGTVDLSLWLELMQGELGKATANFVVHELGVESDEPSSPFDIEGRLEYSTTENGWLLAAENFSMRTVDGDWPKSSIQVQIDVGPNETDIEAIVANASFIDLDDLRYLLPWLPEAAVTMFELYRPSGEIRDLRADVVGLQTEHYRFDVSAQLADAGIATSEKFPGIHGFTGSIRANLSGGRLELDSSNLQIDLPQYLSETLVFDDAIGTVIWRRNNDGITVLSDSVRLRNADFDSQSSLQVRIHADGTSPDVDLDSRWSINDIASVKRFLPREILNPALYRWLNQALVSGVVTRGTTVLNGPLDKFPFDGGEGVFRIDARLENATLRYANSWPAAQLRSLDLVIDGTHLYSNRNDAENAGNHVLDARFEILDLRNPVLTIDAFATGTLGSIREFSRRSPIAALFGGQLDNVQVEGDASFNLQLVYPIKDWKNYSFTTRIQLSGGTMSIDGFDAPITDLNGIVTVTRDSVSSESLFGRFLGEYVDIDVAHAGQDMPSTSVIVNVKGVVSSEALIKELGVPLGDKITGSSEYRAKILFPRGGLDEPVPLQISITSDMVGISFDLPEPLKKAREKKSPLVAMIEFPAQNQIVSSGSLDDDIKWSLDFRKDENGWDFDRGVLVSGGAYPGLPESRGLHIRGHADEIRLTDWLDLAKAGVDSTASLGLGTRIRSMDLTIGNLYLYGQHILDHRVVVDRGANEWVVRVSGEQAEGSITIPYDLTGDRPITLDMETLTLPGGGEDGPGRDVDPRTLAAISITAKDFTLGNRHLGAVEADFLRVPNGLHASGLKVADASFTIEGDAGWIVDPSSEGGQRSYLKAELNSTNVQRTMQRLDYQPGIDSGAMLVSFDVSWPGGPREDFLADLDGEIRLRLGEGTLNEVEPGAGRIFGLMSVAALPRRLSLDFRDVFEKGLRFDNIRGSFRLENGNAYTCDLSLEGPAADVGIVGRAGLASKDYDQTAIVSANVGNTLPIVGAVVAGPQVAAALLIFSQIFKKPLREMGQVYYGIDGTFDEPVVETADAERFARNSELAKCLVVEK